MIRIPFVYAAKITQNIGTTSIYLNFSFAPMGLLYIIVPFHFGRGSASLYRLPNILRPDGTSRPAPWNPIGVTGL